MDFLYNIIFYISYFFIFIIFSIIAIIFAKKLHSWIWYSIGAIITLLSLLGNQKTANYLDSQDYMIPYWFIYFFLLIGVAIIMLARYSKANGINNSKNINEVEEKQIYKCEMCDLICEKTTYARITDNMGIRYRNLCDACMEKYKAMPENKKK